MFDSSLEELFKQLKFSHWGATPLEKPISIDIYKSWVADGKHANMNYLKTQITAKEFPTQHYNFARSALCFAIPYLPHLEGPSPLPKLKLARYAQGRDYHHWLIEKLNLVINHLKIKYPQEEFLSVTDSAPILERDLGARGGLGWFGKNTCLIHPKQGSFFLLGEILTSLELKTTSSPVPDFCGTCTRCIEACPTKALDVKTKSLDSNLCLAYWNIESREVPPENIRSSMGEWLFGCDICQQVCPWNQKVFKTELKLEAAQTPPTREEILTELRWILESSNRQIQKRIQGTPLMRAGPFGLKRNALIVAGNLKAFELKDAIANYLEHSKLQELCTWSLSEILKS